jgi:hypothetical protein
VADKLTQHILDALGKAAASPAGLPLFQAKGEDGLFPSTAIAKSASQKCLADGLIEVERTETKGRGAREWYALTSAGWEYLLEAGNPKQVLEDFVRVLESRQCEIQDLLAGIRRLATELNGIREAVSRVLPQIVERRVSPGPADPHRASTAGGLSEAILHRLADRDATARHDCPLPDLFRTVAGSTLGEFHDALRQLHAAGAIYLHPWTGPLHEMPDPAHALLIGHNIAYYASLRTAEDRGQRAEVRGQRPETCPLISVL